MKQRSNSLAYLKKHGLVERDRGRHWKSTARVHQPGIRKTVDERDAIVRQLSGNQRSAIRRDVRAARRPDEQRSAVQRERDVHEVMRRYADLYGVPLEVIQDAFLPEGTRRRIAQRLREASAATT